MSKNKTKLDSAVEAVENKSVVRAVEVGDMTITSKQEAMEVLQSDSGVTAFDPMRFLEAVKQEGFVAAERFIKLEEGQQIEGYYLGRSKATIEDLNTKEDKVVDRFRFELTSGAFVSMLETTQVSGALEGAPEDGSALVIIAKGGSQRTNRGRIMDHYFVAVKLNARAPKLRLPLPASFDDIDLDKVPGGVKKPGTPIAPENA